MARRGMLEQFQRGAQIGSALGGGIEKVSENLGLSKKQKDAVSALDNFINSLPEQQKKQFAPVANLMQEEAKRSGNLESAISVGSSLLKFTQQQGTGLDLPGLQKKTHESLIKEAIKEDIDLSKIGSTSELAKAVEAAKLKDVASRKRTELEVARQVKQEEEMESFKKDIKPIAGDMADLFNTLSSIPMSVRGPLAGRTLGQLETVTQDIPEVADYVDSKQFFLSNIARSLGGERGVLTDRDIKRVNSAFPQISDTEEVAIRKMERVKRLIARRIEERGTPEMLDEFNKNFDVSQFGKNIEKKNIDKEALLAEAKRRGLI